MSRPRNVAVNEIGEGTILVRSSGAERMGRIGRRKREIDYV